MKNPPNQCGAINTLYIRPKVHLIKKIFSRYPAVCSRTCVMRIFVFISRKTLPIESFWTKKMGTSWEAFSVENTNNNALTFTASNISEKTLKSHSMLHEFTIHIYFRAHLDAYTSYLIVMVAIAPQSCAFMRVLYVYIYIYMRMDCWHSKPNHKGYILVSV